MTRTVRVTAAVAVAAAIGGGLWMYRHAEAHEAPQYRTAPVTRESLQSTVSSTGTLSAVRTVEVGTQVSGQIAALYVDFNSHVKKGQLIARVDPILEEQAVQDAQAQVAKARAQLAQAQEEYGREQSLHDQKIITETEYNTARANYQVAKASLSSAQITLDRARQNLAYCSIYAPIDGVVTERDVDVGQTVAASFSSPKLFVIANDLAQMQILASVDESDIGKIHEGQAVRFTVQSYSTREFTGAVQQVRLNAATSNNVVNYTVVVGVPNPEGKLLPGMTTTVKFVTGVADSVLTVPNTALRFRPADASAATPGGAAPAGAPTGGFAPGAGAAPGGATRTGGRQGRDSTAGVLFTVAAGKLVPHRVRVGLTDGTRTQVSAPDLTPGTAVVVASTQPGAAAAATSASTNPFQQQQGQRRGPPGPF